MSVYHERMSDRAAAAYGAGIPIDDIKRFTGKRANTIRSLASRRGIRRPDPQLTDAHGELDPELVSMSITAEAAQEALEYWEGVSKRHADYWRGLD